jgi:SOS-response transcriptional repressor LexA
MIMTMRDTLTSRQSEVQSFIVSYIARHGLSPTHREIGEAIGVRSPNAVLGLIRGLRDKGYLDWDAGKARSFRIVGKSTILVDDSIKDDVVEYARGLMYLQAKGIL